MNIQKSICRVSRVVTICRFGLAVTIIAAIGLLGCNDNSNKPANKVLLADINPMEGDNNSYQVSINDTGHFIRIFSDESWSIYLSYPNPENQDWATISKTSGNGNGMARLSYPRNPDSPRSLVINILFDSSEETLTLTQLGLGGNGNQAQLSEWLEIPQTPQVLSGSSWTITHFIPDRLGMRNFTVLFDTLQCYPMWVAYPLHNCYNGGSGRTDKWAYDPNMPTDYQPNMLRGMSNGYGRGHMLPSASRYLTTLTNNQTFYFTNMTAQMSSFNAEVWAELEGRVRVWAGYGNTYTNDTLYVVTGAVLKRVDITTDVVTKVNCRGKQIPVPNYYYKALLMKKGSGWKAIAWWFKHEPAERSVLPSDAISIRELESRTGINFFANLPQSDQDAVEVVEWNSSDWPLGSN